MQIEKGLLTATTTTDKPGYEHITDTIALDLQNGSLSGFLVFKSNGMKRQKELVVKVSRFILGPTGGPQRSMRSRVEVRYR